MNVRLTPELERLVRLKVDTGAYASASDVVGEALRLMEERDRAHTALISGAHSKIASGMASLRAGAGVDGDDFLDLLDRELAELEGHAPA